MGSTTVRQMLGLRVFKMGQLKEWQKRPLRVSKKGLLRALRELRKELR